MLLFIAVSGELQTYFFPLDKINSFFSWMFQKFSLLLQVYLAVFLLQELTVFFSSTDHGVFVASMDLV